MTFVALSVVNALSELLTVRVDWRDGKTYEQTFSRGDKLTERKALRGQREGAGSADRVRWQCRGMQ